MTQETERGRGRISVPEIAARLSTGRMAVYSMLEQRIIPAIRLGRRWIVTRFVYEDWERRCGKNETFHVGPTGGMCGVSSARNQRSRMSGRKRRNSSGKVVWCYRFDAPGTTRQNRREVREFGFATKQEAIDAEGMLRKPLKRLS